MIAACGINCRKCPAFVMTRFADRTGMKGLAQWLLRLGGAKEEMWCDGCSAIDARTVKHCRECAVRNCTMERGLANCTLCDKFPCEALLDLWKITVFKDAEPRLRKIRRARSGQVKV